jgi:hypothetical protein
MSHKYPPAVSLSKTSEVSAPIVPRQFARAVVDLPAQYAIAGELEWHPSIIDSLGGGGVRLQTQADVAGGTIVTLRFDVEGTPIDATARIAMSLFDRSRKCFVHGAAFTAIDAAQQQTILRRVIELQADVEADRPKN